MKRFLVLFIFLESFSAQSALIFPATRRSESFLVHDYRAGSMIASRGVREEGRDLIQLDPNVVLVSAEKIREALFSALKAPSHPGDRIHLCLNRARGPREGVTVSPNYFTDGWRYRLDIPDQLERFEFLHGIVRALLTELANRQTGPRTAEIPRWLSEGMSAYLAATVGPELVMSSVPLGSSTRSIRLIEGSDRLPEVRDFLRQHPALSIRELSRPAEELLRGAGALRFRYSAHFLVHSLLRMPNGPAHLVRLLRGLPQYWNWEIAFLQAYEPRFRSMLDLEKWWLVSLMALTGRDPTQFLTMEAGLQKLDDILLVPVRIYLSTNSLPERSQVTLQQLISEWQFPVHQPVVAQTIRNLQSLKNGCPLDLQPLVGRYESVLQNYLERRLDTIYRASIKRQIQSPDHLIVREAMRQLDDLYREREALKRSQLSVVRADVPAAGQP